VPDDVLGSVEAPLYLTAAMTGLRQGELIALRWIDVDRSASRIRVADSYVRGAFDSPKNHRGRSVPMADRLAGKLERCFQAPRWRAENDLVFAHPRPASTARDYARPPRRRAMPRPTAARRSGP
jgi:integrase